MKWKVWFRRAGGVKRSVTRTVAMVKKVSTFKPFRSKAEPRDPNRTDYCDVDLTDASYLSPKYAERFKLFPKKKKSPRVLMETVDYYQSHQPLFPPRNDHDSDEEEEEKKRTKKRKMDHKKNDNSAASEPTEKRKKQARTGGGGGGGGRISQKKAIDGPNPPPPIPEEMREKIESYGGGAAVLLLQKQLCESDVSIQQSRFSVPIRQLETPEFLREEEIAAARERDEGNYNNRVVGMKGFTLVDPKCNEYKVDFKQWDAGSWNAYVITGKWAHVLAKNRFKKGDIVQLWFFRDSQDNPCFALAKIPRPDDHDDIIRQYRRRRRDRSFSSK